jgi:hypothetical protein
MYMDKIGMCHLNIIRFSNTKFQCSMNINNKYQQLCYTISPYHNVQCSRMSELYDGGGGGRLSAGLKWAVRTLN